MLNGIDVSRWQGRIDWGRVQTDFAYIKLGGADDGIYTDSRALANFAGARGRSIPFGPYWFFDGREDYNDQLAHILSLRSHFEDALLPFSVDIESGGPASIDLGLALADRLQAAGLRIIIYTGAWWWNPRWSASEASKRGPVPFPLWGAGYGPSLPIPSGWEDWLVWQTSDKGTMPGIAGPVDTNVARERFWADAQPKEPKVPKYRVTATALNVRPGPVAAGGTVVDTLKTGDVVEAKPPVNGWHEVALGENYTVGGIPATPTIGKRRLPDVGFISASWTQPVDIPPPPPTGYVPYQLGLHVIGDHGAATKYISEGCPYITEMHGKLEMIQHKLMMQAAGIDGDMVFRYWAPGDLSIEQIVSAIDPRPDSPSYTVVLSNEMEWTNSMQWHAERDYKVATALKMRQPNIKVAAASWAHGTPDFTNPEICRIVEKGWAKWYNEGLFDYIDGHNYTHNKSFAHHPPADGVMDGPEWFETRLMFLIKSCGFRPDKQGFINTEAGAEAGHGGMRWAGYTIEQFREWLALFLRRMRASFVFNGVTYPSPYKFGTFFMVGKDQTWSGGYGIDDLWSASRSLSAGIDVAKVAKYLPRKVLVKAEAAARKNAKGLWAPSREVATLASADDYRVTPRFVGEIAKTWAR